MTSEAVEIYGCYMLSRDWKTIIRMNKHNTSQLYPVFATMATLFTYAAVMTIPAASVNQLADNFHVSNATVSSVFRLFMAGFLVAALFGGRISDRVGKMPIVASGCALMGAGMCIFFQAAHFHILPYAAFIAGLGGGLTEVVGTALLSDLYNGPKRTAMMNWSQVVFAAGAVASPLLFGHLLKIGTDWRMGYLIVTALCAIAVTLAVIGSKKPEKEAVAESGASLSLMIRDSRLQKLSLALLLYVGSELGIVYWIARYLEKDLLAPHDMAANSVAVLWVGLGIGRWIATGLPRRLSDANIIRLSLSLSVVIASVLLFAKNPTLGLVLTLFTGVPLGPVWPTIVSRAGCLYPEQSGTVVGMVASVGCVGATLIPSLVGKLSDSFGVRAALWTSVVGLALALMIMLTDKTKSDR